MNDRSANSARPAAPTPPPTSVPLFDTQRQYRELASEITAAVNRVCASGQYILGPDVAALESALADWCQTAHAIACASGSDALLLALMACGIGPGDEVICPSYTFFATASGVARLGARPVFVDIDPESFNLDPSQVARSLTPATKALLPVHLFGQCAEMGPLRELAREHGLPVIEDAAQAIGAEYGGSRAGGLGDVGCFSFYPTKNLGGMGDGGLLTTNRDDLAQRLRLLRAHGMQPRYVHHVLGINSRLDSLQAAVLNVKLAHLPRWTARRAALADRYAQRFAAAELDGMLTLPAAAPGRKHVWNQYVIRVPEGRRDALREHLSRQQIGTEIYYPVPLHLQPCFSGLGCRVGDLPETERAAAQALALPVFPELTPGEQDLVVGEIAAFFGKRLPPAEPPSGAVLAGPNFLRRAPRSAAADVPQAG